MTVKHTQKNIYVPAKRRELLSLVEEARKKVQQSTGGKVTSSDIILDCIEAQLSPLKNVSRSEGEGEKKLAVIGLPQLKRETRHQNVNFSEEDLWVLEAIHQYVQVRDLTGNKTNVSREIVRLLKTALTSDEPYGKMVRRTLGLKMEGE